MPRQTLLLALTFLSGLLTASAQSRLLLRVRDQQTHFAVPATVQVKTAEGTRLLQTDRTGSLPVDLPAGRVELHFSTPGYDALATYFLPEAGQSVTAEILLDPQVRKPQPDVTGRCVIEGFVSDQYTGAPLAGATVHFQSANATITTDAAGFFQYETERFAALSAPSVAPVYMDIRVSKAGYGTRTLAHFLVTPGTHSLPVALAQGSPETIDYQTHGILDRNPQAVPQAEIHPELSVSAGPENIQACSANASIRVGTGCSCNTCTGVSVMSLESYVESGLDNEWISSWAANSLRAGSVAYRSYGAYHTTHPYNGTYDLASSTCRQVWEAATASSCINAAKATAGEVLAQNGATARSEYSAENNGFACSDGYTGSPTYNWPCNADNVCAGKTANGHGRGMCQWGSQRWASAQGQLYPWILDHYYAIGGVTRCTLSGSTGTEALAETVSLSPNPASDALTISAPYAPLRVLLYDSRGVPVYSGTKLRLDVSQLPAGLYFLTVVFAEGVWSSRVMVE